MSLSCKMMRNDSEEWNIIEVASEKLNICQNVAQNLLHMVEVEECTVPFIARYRKEKTKGMEADKLRRFVETVNDLREVQKKACTMIKSIEKQGKLKVDTERSLKCAQTMDELNQMYAPYKGDRKHSLADRARDLGLEEASLYILEHPKENISLRKWVKKGKEGCATLSDVERHVQNLIADHIAKHPSTFKAVQEIFQTSGMILESKISPAKKKSVNKTSSKPQTPKKPHVPKSKADDKYHLYYDFRCAVLDLKSYQVLAINRGENQKHLTVKIVISCRMEDAFHRCLKQRWYEGLAHPETRNIVQPCLDDAYNRLIKPFVLRKERANLTNWAHLEAVQVFCRNLKKLLLTAPVRGKRVLGVDPGFKNGCKCAVLSSTGNVLATDIFNLNHRREALAKVKLLYEQHRFEVVSIGNGTACRETEKFISSFIEARRYENLVYCIVSEDGASTYSVTDAAKKEMPDLEPNLRSAVSIARRLQDPLVELVKIEPKHIGVGMYQHDIPGNMLKAALASVVEDCVTFVGVDINVADASLLSHVAGLGSKQVKNILEWRKKNGSFINRQQLLEVSSIGKKTFQQCAGFMRIPQSNALQNFDNCIVINNTDTEGEENCIVIDDTDAEEIVNGRKRRNLKSGKRGVSKKRKTSEHSANILDQTWIHPESYDVTKKFLCKIECPVSKLGTKWFIDQIKNALMKQSLSSIAHDLNVGEPTLQLIVDGLSQPSGYRDIREESSKPLYRKGLQSLEDLRCGSVMRGRVTNVTDFGVFVDVGVGEEGLMHYSDMGSLARWDELKHCLGPNDVITVMCKRVNSKEKKLAFKLVNAAVSKPQLL